MKDCLTQTNFLSVGFNKSLQLRKSSLRNLREHVFTPTNASSGSEFKISSNKLRVTKSRAKQIQILRSTSHSLNKSNPSNPFNQTSNGKFGVEGQSFSRMEEGDIRGKSVLEKPIYTEEFADVKH
jgi:hypothetical protein